MEFFINREKQVEFDPKKKLQEGEAKCHTNAEKERLPIFYFKENAFQNCKKWSGVFAKVYKSVALIYNKFLELFTA